MDSDEEESPDQAIHRAARAGDLDGLRAELDAGVSPDLMYVSYDLAGLAGGRPLTILCDSIYGYQGPEENRVRGVRMLIEAGASLAMDASRGFSPLKTAAARGNLQLVQMLLEAGADVHETTYFGWTALHAAVGSSSTNDWFGGPEGPRRVRSAFDCAAALLAAGADPNAMVGSGSTPLSIVTSVVPSHLTTPLYAVLLRGGAILNRDETPQSEAEARSPYLNKVYQAGGWERYAQAHRKQLVATFAPKLRLPADVIPLVVDFWANVGMY